MVIHELTPAECDEIVVRTNLGRLGCARAGQPYIVPIFFAFDRLARCLYSFSTLGQKIEWMRSNPKVCVQVDEIADQFHWTSILITGLYQEISDSPRESDALRRAHDLFQQRSAWWLPAAGKLATGEKRDNPVVYRIRIATMSGRRAARPSGQN
jgi:nitroimidazol reductase NimA-like FMN-containing flavoprotein (pyridoxamine 5'-phosphate oxidase superfamily)